MNKKGYTILELLVSMGIFSMAIIAIIGLMIFNNKINNNNEMSITGAYLAKEGIEVVTYLRDNNFLNNRNYSYNFYNSRNKDFILIFNGNNWNIDYGPANESIESCCLSQNNSCAVFKTNNYYTQSRTQTGEKTEYCRLISINQESGYLDIKSKVLYKDGKNNNIIELDKRLYDWK